MNKIGILGGTFDPIHKGHIKMAEAALKQCGLSKVLFMPTGNPPHKSNITSADKRIEMLKLSISDYPKFEISDVELNREGVIYTADTIDILEEMYADSELYYIIGADSLAYIDKWYHPERFLDKVVLTVCKRKDVGAYEMVIKTSEITRQYNAHIKVLQFDCVDISSSEIRSDPDYYMEFLPKKVYDYIKKEGLYV